MPSAFKNLFVLFLPVAFLAACSNAIAVYGYVPHQSRIDQAVAGEADRKEVRDLFGAPFTLGTFDENYWFYIERRTRIRGILEPKLLDQRVLVVKFDEENGTLAGTQMYEVTDANDIRPVGRKTASLGKELNVIQEIFNNIGRFGGAGGGGLPGI